MSNRTALLDALAEQINAHAVGYAIVDVDKLAASLFSKYPQSGFTVAEVATIIEVTAGERHIPLLAGRKRNDPPRTMRRRRS